MTRNFVMFPLLMIGWLTDLVTLVPLQGFKGSFIYPYTTQGCIRNASSLHAIHTTKNNYYIWWSAEDELRSLRVWRKKLLCSLVVRQWLLLYRLPDGTRLLLWQVLSLYILWALCRHFTSLISLMLSRLVPMTFWAVLITWGRALLSWAGHEPCQFVMFQVKLHSIASL